MVSPLVFSYIGPINSVMKPMVGSRGARASGRQRGYTLKVCMASEPEGYISKKKARGLHTPNEQCYVQESS